MSKALNFLALPQRGRLGWLVLALGGTSLWIGANALFSQQDQAAEFRQKITLQEQNRRRSVKPLLPDKAETEANVLANNITEEIRYSWAQTLRELEAADGVGVVVKGFEHNQAKKTTRLELQIVAAPQSQEVMRRLKQTSGEEYLWTIGNVVRNEQGYRVVLHGVAL